MHAALKFMAIGFLSLFSFCVVAPVSGYSATVAEVAAKIKSLKQQERTSFLLRGARAEEELVYYGTLPINESCHSPEYSTSVIVPLFCTITSPRATAFLAVP